MTDMNTSSCSLNLGDDDASTVILTPSVANVTDIPRSEVDAVAALLMLSNHDSHSVGDEVMEVDPSDGEPSDDDDEIDHGDAAKMDYDDDGPIGYYEMRTNDTLAGWTYSRHTRSICLTPPRAWMQTPCEINVQWYKRPLFYSTEHAGYFMSNAQCFVDKVEELGAVYDQERVWE